MILKSVSLNEESDFENYDFCCTVVHVVLNAITEFLMISLLLWMEKV